ncbi:MAG: fused MFS/spermidine synthase, partial [Planctomycetota bacterium]
MGRDEFSKLSYPFPLYLLWPAVLLSGATALVYEILWMRRLSLVLGSTTQAAAAVLSAFMLGLALGALVVGRIADRSKRPLRWYAILEIGIGVYALAFDPLLKAAESIVGTSPFLYAFALLVIPAALMGGTLPVLSRAAADTTERGTRALGSLYGLNTLGAVLGALLTVFFLMERFGLRGATTIAAAVNIGLGVLFWGFSWAAGERTIFAAANDGKSRSWRGDADVAVVAAFFLTGFAGLALEMAWVRMLVYFLEGFTIAFGVMLAAYLLGLGAGALAGTWLALLSTNPRRLLARIMLIEAVLALATFLLAGSISDGLEKMRGGYTTAASMDGSYALGLFWAAAAVVFPAIFCAGMLLPVVARIALSDRESIGRQTGAVYAATTLGAVLAPPVAGFWLIPALGVPGTIASMAALVLLAGTAVAFKRGLREWVPAGAAAVVFVALCLAADLRSPLVKVSHVFRAARSPRRLREFKEGLLSGASVVEELKDGTRRLYLDGFSAAETSRHYGYMRMLGHLPVLLHPDPKEALVIAFGTGTTAGAVAVHPVVKRVVCVEIEPAVYDLADEFTEQNREVLKSDKTEVVIADGREFVRRGERKFDVITLEPLMPYTPAAVYLYTKEFYEDARRSLDTGGMLCQWVPPQGVSNADLRRLIASMAAVFDHVSIWYFEHAIALLGADTAPRIDTAEFFKRCATREVVDDLVLARVGDPAHLLGSHVCSGQALTQALRNAVPMVDDRTDLEFRPLPRRFGKRSQTYHAENLEFLSAIHQAEPEWLVDVLPGVRPALAGVRVALQTLAAEARGRIEATEVIPASVLADVVEKDPGGLFALSIMHRRLYDEMMARQMFGEAAQLTHAPDRNRAYLALAGEAEGEKRLHYLKLALRQNALLPPEVLTELGEALDGPARRFCLNRARAQKGEPLEEGEEALPAIATPDLTAELESGDIERVREALEEARRSDQFEKAEKSLYAWWRRCEDKREALKVLYEAGSTKAVLAAGSLFSEGGEENLIAVAPVFGAVYPKKNNWEILCRDTSAAVRAAA